MGLAKPIVGYMGFSNPGYLVASTSLLGLDISLVGMITSPPDEMKLPPP
jgi:hypothetical protein